MREIERERREIETREMGGGRERGERGEKEERDER